ncbi:MAG: response regulator, partial [candidate division NC10 bacterium]|nr:response regulator [candidate division NC10 bacterium]
MTSWRILVVDDEPLVLHMLRDVLTRLPADVLEAKEGEEALRLAKAERPDLILLDVMMPRMDGYQVAAALKQDPTTATIPIIFISALGSSRDKVRGLDLGAEDYLVKPVDPEELKV